MDTAERNKDIYNLRQQGLSYRKIASRYGLSHERIRQIIQREQRKKDRLEAARKQEKANLKKSYSFYDALVETRIEMNLSNNLETRVYRCLGRAGIINDICAGKHTLDDYSDEYLLSIRNFGKESLKLTRKAYETWKNRQKNLKPFSEFLYFNNSSIESR